LLLLSPALHAADKEPAPPEPKRKGTAISLLPNGSQLQRVMLPRYDEKHRLTGVLKAETMTLVTDEIIAGESVTIGFFNPDGSPRGRVELAKATLNQGNNLLQAREKTTILTDRILATGTGLIYAFDQGEGFLSGPAVTRIQQANETAMNPRTSPRRAAAVSLLAGTTLIAAQPAALTPQEKSAIAADATTAAPAHSESSSESKKELRAELDASAAATAAATSFLEKSDLASSQTGTTPPPSAPLEVKPDPNDTVINCEGGMYFNSDEGVFVYLKNVRVTDPRFTLSGANELKVFLSKKPEKKPEPKPEQKPGPQLEKKPAKPAPDGKPAIGLGAKFGDVERIVATGAVRILQKQPEAGKEPVEASGAIFVYHPKTGEIVLTGGYPWVRQGANFMRANEPGLNLRIQKNGSFVTEGNWSMGGKLDQNR
jgi:lipopolysaccharide export system protein LptA